MITKELLIFVVQRTKNRLMQDWSKYIERPIADVLSELAASPKVFLGSVLRQASSLMLMAVLERVAFW